MKVHGCSSPLGWHQLVQRTHSHASVLHRATSRPISRNTAIANGLRAEKRADAASDFHSSSRKSTAGRQRRRVIAATSSPLRMLMQEKAPANPGHTRPNSLSPAPSTQSQIINNSERYLAHSLDSPESTPLTPNTSSLIRYHGRAGSREHLENPYAGSSLNWTLRNIGTNPSSPNSSAKTHFGHKFDKGSGPKPLPASTKPRKEHSAQHPVPVPYATAASVLIPGARAVLAALRANRRKLYKLYAANGMFPRADINTIFTKADLHNVPIARVSRHWIDRVVTQLAGDGSIVNDGVLLDASPLPQVPVESLGFYSRFNESFNIELQHQTLEDAEINGSPERLTYNSNGWRRPFLVWLHEVVDTQNIGAIARSCLFLGADAIVLTKRGTGSLTDLGAKKAAAGAGEFMPVLTVENPETFMRLSIRDGWKFWAAVAPSKDSSVPHLGSLSFNPPTLLDPCVLMLGNEDQGLPKSLVQLASQRITINGSKEAKAADVDSLNVSVAAAMIMDRFLLMPPRHVIEQQKRKGGNETVLNVVKESREPSGDDLRPAYAGAPRSRVPVDVT